jgi:hypothetical protein
MEAGVLLRFGKPIVGRERQSLALFAETISYLTELRDKGTITWFEPFMLEAADYEEEVGFVLIKGPAEKILALREDERWLNLISKALVLAQHVKVTTVRVGEAVTEQMDRVGKVYAELGI